MAALDEFEIITHKVTQHKDKIGNLQLYGGPSGPARVLSIPRDGLCTNLNLQVSDIVVQINGIAITEGAKQAAPLLRDTTGTFTFICHRPNTPLLPTCRGDGTPSEASPSSSPRSAASTPHKDGAWLEPTILTVHRGEKLGVTVSQHDEIRSGPGVKVTDLNPNGRCAEAGMVVGSALLSVCGKPVQSHQQAIQLMEAEARSSATSSVFEVVVREPAPRSETPVVQSL